MNPYAIPPALAALLNIALLGWVFSSAPRGAVRRSFLRWTLWLGLWNAWLTIGYNLSDAQEAFVWYKYFGAVIVRLLAPLFLHFIIAVTNSADKAINRRILQLAYASGIMFAVMDASTPWLMAGVRHYFWGYYPVAAKGDVLFGLSFFAIVLYAFRLLWQCLRTSTDHRQNQMKYLLGGLIICFGSAVTNFLPIYGISIYPVGNLMNSFYALVIAFAIIEYGLLDIRLVLRRSVVYGILSGGLTAVYLSLVAVLERLFGHYGIQESAAFYTAAFPLTVILAPAMKSRIEPFVDHAFFGGILHGPKPPPRTQDMALMGILATEMAHELAKPLTHIMNAGSRLERSIKGLPRENLRTIEKEVQRASEILDGFSMLSPERTLHRIAIPLTDLVEEAVTTLDLSEDKTLQLIRHFGAIPPTYVNPGQIVQVLTNLIQNAWQAMPEGGRLTLSIQPVTGDKNRPEAEISIIDTGRGIAPNILEKVFEPFFTTKHGQGGRGMGLTISRAMVERHGGTIEIQSPVTGTGGTRVVVRLPILSSEGSHEK